MSNPADFSAQAPVKPNTDVKWLVRFGNVSFLVGASLAAYTFYIFTVVFAEYSLLATERAQRFSTAVNTLADFKIRSTLALFLALCSCTVLGVGTLLLLIGRNVKVARKGRAALPENLSLKVILPICASAIATFGIAGFTAAHVLIVPYTADWLAQQRELDDRQRAADDEEQLDVRMAQATEAIDTDHLSVLKELLDGGLPVNRPSGWSTLLTRAAGGNTEMIEMLLAHGADINQTDKSGRPPLFLALTMDNRKSVECLLRHHPDINAVRGPHPGNDDEFGCNSLEVEESPLVIALLRQNYAVVQLLLESGADPNRHASQKGTLLDAFEKLNFSYIERPRYLALLRQHGAKTSAELNASPKTSPSR